MYHHKKKKFTKAGQVNPELIFEKMGTLYSQGQLGPVLWCCLIGVLRPDSVHKYEKKIQVKVIEVHLSSRLKEKEKRVCLLTSLRKQTFLLTSRRFGGFAKRDVCASATDIPY